MALRDPAVAIQAGVVAALKASPDMIAAFGGPPQVFDTVPVDTAGNVLTGAFPYCTIGDDQILPGTLNSNTDPSEAYVKVETWSRPQNPVNNGEVKSIAGAVRAALDASIPLIGHDVITHAFHGTLYRRQPDGLTRHAVTTIRYTTTPVGVSTQNP
jgi:hypothetical protein